MSCILQDPVLAPTVSVSVIKTGQPVENAYEWCAVLGCVCVCIVLFDLN